MTDIKSKSFRPKYDRDAECYRYHFDPESTVKPSTAAVLALGSITGEHPREMPVLSDSINPESLNYHISNKPSNRTLTFEYHGHTVTVNSTGDVEFLPLGRGVHA